MPDHAVEIEWPELEEIPLIRDGACTRSHERTILCPRAQAHNRGLQAPPVARRGYRDTRSVKCVGGAAASKAPTHTA